MPRAAARLCALALVLCPIAAAQVETADAFLLEKSELPAARVLPEDAAVPAIEPVVPAFCAEAGSDGCRFRWRAALRQSGTFLTILHAGNLALNPGMRHELTHGHFFRDYATALRNYRFHRWADDDPPLVDYVGHPLMGAVAGRIQIQNDPAGAVLEFGRSGDYWKSRMRAMAWSTAFAWQWELGPLSESSLGNLGNHEYTSQYNGKRTNGTGMQDLVLTPTLGTAWLVTEDVLDRYAIQRLEQVSGNPVWLTAVSALNPSRGFANLLRGRSPWHRDSRPSPRGKRAAD